MHTRRLAPVILALLACSVNASAQPTREITYNPRSVVRLDTKIRMTTVVILPEAEEILEFVCGDKDYWSISGAQNLAYVKPAKTGATTNLNLVTASGRIYSFLLVEGAAAPNLKVFIVPDGTAAPSTRVASRISTTESVQVLTRELAAAREEAERVKRDADDSTRANARASQEAIDKFKAAYPTQLQFPYHFKLRAKPFNVTAIYHDDRFTYIQANARELPALYEVVDHAPNLVSYQVEHGVFIVPKVLDHGYLVIGKQRLTFDIASR